LDAYDRAAAQGPSVGAYARVARARELLGRSAGALDALELAIEAGSGIDEQKAWALMRYGSVLLSVGRVEDATAAFRRSLELEPRFPHARAGLARAAAARGATSVAVRRFVGLLRDTPSAEYATELGDLHLSLGMDRKANRAYERARKFEERLARSGVRTMLASASLDLDRGLRLASALERARMAYREAPNVETEDALAWALVRNGRCLEARAWSKRSLELGSRDATIFFHRGMIERCLGDPSAARWFAEAIATDPGFSARWAPLAKRLSVRD
jgi:tetratricopeptide (TPR) repeat protein